jgi:glycyl-tRNA synthetase beta chain
MMRHDLLIEIGTEELPPKALKRLMLAFAESIRSGVSAANLHCVNITPYATPRRLAVWVEQLDARQADKSVERRGPAVSAAYDSAGNPSRALLGFAASCGVSHDQLSRIETPKGSWLVHTAVQPGEATSELIPAIIQQALDALPIPKRMRWGSGSAEFVRPVHWLVVLFGDQLIDCTLLGVRSGRETRGHRFMRPDPIYVGEAAAWAPLLESQGRVIADFSARREAIRGQVLAAAAHEGGRAILDEDLLDEVTGLVEWPVALVGYFEPRFLEVPAEALISTMQANQKYFPLVDSNNRLLPAFITITNLESLRPDLVRAGNERVIRPRLADAAFFWQQDRRTPLADRYSRLQGVIFQQQLGSLFDKSQRVAAIAAALAQQLGHRSDYVIQAAQLAKCDLLTEMVGEFPELQGVMGRYYALHDGVAAEVATAIDEQYQPRFAGDELPASITGQILAVAEKIDSLMGLFAIGQPPTGDKDPFALRRAALGVLRILIERQIPVDLATALALAAQQLPAKLQASSAITPALDFILGRLKGYFADRGVPNDTFEAVVALRPTEPVDFANRIDALARFRQLPAATTLAAADKRIGNILKKAGDIPASSEPLNLLQEREELELSTALEKIEQYVSPLINQRYYTEALTALADLHEPVNRFFDTVMVMCDDPALRLQRLQLLKRLHSLFTSIADLSRLQESV